MTLHIFNPEHDLSLACNQRNFTPPVAARLLRRDLGFIPALWAGEGDAVLVADARDAGIAFALLGDCIRRTVGEIPILNKGVRFVEEDELQELYIDTVDAWGWDVALCGQLVRHGVSEEVLPDSENIETIRDLSHRRHVAGLLEHLRMDGVVGESFECSDYGDVERLLSRYRDIVVKAPWSSSGRGIRFLMGSINAHQSGWIKNMLKAQGSVIVEPYYNRIADFGMEFCSDGNGNVRYLGLSLFETDNWAYAGSIVAAEDYKADVLSEYVSKELLYKVREGIVSYLGRAYAGRYRGAFGVDMMIVDGSAGSGYLLHPCVEINLRRTMGHVAIGLTPEDSRRRGIMKIENINNKHQLKINSL